MAKTTWVDYLLKHKEQQEISYRHMARACGKSDAAWHALITGKGPPSYEMAEKIAGVLDMSKEVFLNLVFQGRLIRYFEREGILENHPTRQAGLIIQLLTSWNPAEGPGQKPFETTVEL